MKTAQARTAAPELTGADSAHIGLAIAEDIKFLARLHDRELDEETLAALHAEPVADWFSLRLQGAMLEEGSRLVTEALAALPCPADRKALDDHAAEFAAIYLTYSYRCAPSESVWRDEEQLERQAAMFAVRDWYEHFSVKVPNWRIRSDDHLVHELEFLALLLEGATDVKELDHAARFLREHPLVWIPEFARRVVQRCRLPFYAGTALLTAAYLEHLATFLALLTGRDMKPAPLKLAPVGPLSKSGPTCGDPPPARYVPGLAPSW